MRRTQGSKRNRGALGAGGRTIAALLALVWIAAGMASLVLAFGGYRWAGAAFGLPAVIYGMLWLRVAHTGTLLRWRAHRR